MNTPTSIPPFEKGGLGGILNAAISAGAENPPRSPFYKGGRWPGQASPQNNSEAAI
jgi:hypothetical protein